MTVRVAVPARADGFGAAGLLAATIAAAACLATFLLVRADETAPAATDSERPCKLIDCRGPL